MDDPKEIVKGALDLHTKMIKQMKGVPGSFIFFSYFDLQMVRPHLGLSLFMNASGTYLEIS